MRRRLVWVWLFFLLLYILSKGDFVPSVMYITYSQEIPLSSQRIALSDQPNVTAYPDLMKVDDSPFATVQLPFTFPIFGKSTTFVYLSANGGIHLSNSQPCAGYWGATNCNLNTSYYDVMSVFSTDLNPGMATAADANITSSYDSMGKKIEFSWYRLPFFGNDSFESSFRASLYNDGKVTYYYDDVPNPNVMRTLTISSYIGYGVEWITGLRSAKDYRPYLEYTEAQNTTSLMEWQTLVHGIYPSSQSSFQSRLCLIYDGEV